jgi:hypothetical protein
LEPMTKFKMYNLTFKNLFIILSVFAVVSCSAEFMDMEPIENESDIYGFWTDTVMADPAGYSVNGLTFRANGSFVAFTKGYGMYQSQDSSQISYSFEDQGSYVLSARNIYFLSKRQVSWDFMTQNTPTDTIGDRQIFEACTYNITGDTLTLNYITYPADAPQVTVRKYIRIE